MATVKKVKKYQSGGGIKPGYKTIPGTKSLPKPKAKVTGFQPKQEEDAYYKQKEMSAKKSSASDKYTKASVSGAATPGPRMKKGGKLKKAQSGYSSTANRVDSLRAAGAKQIGTPALGSTLKKLKAAEAQEAKEQKVQLSKKKPMKFGGTLSPSKKSVGKTFGKLNKAKYGGKTSKKKK